jgi:hypothetical protein
MLRSRVLDELYHLIGGVGIGVIIDDDFRAALP